MIFTIAAKEVRSLFASPLAWIVLAVFQFFVAWIFLARVDAFMSVQAELREIVNPPGATEYAAAPLFSASTVVFMMIVPLFTMRSIAEERRNQTLTLFLSAPVTGWEIVLGKFFGLMFFLLTAILLVFCVSLSLLLGGSVDPGLLLSNSLGILLVSASFAAFGLYISTLTSHPFLAAIGGIFGLLALWAMSFSREGSAFQMFSPLARFDSFNSGIVSSADLCFFLIFTALFLALSAQRLEKR